MAERVVNWFLRWIATPLAIGLLAWAAWNIGPVIVGMME